MLHFEGHILGNQKGGFLGGRGAPFLIKETLKERSLKEAKKRQEKKERPYKDLSNASGLDISDSLSTVDSFYPPSLTDKDFFRE